MPTPQFRAGDVCQWVTAPDDPTERMTKEIRSVSFIEYGATDDIYVGPTEAVVAYGLKQLRVPLGELSRGEAAPLDTTYFPNGQYFQTPQPSAPLTEEQITSRLEHARGALRAAHDRTTKIRSAVAEARTLADRGAAEVRRVEQELRQLNLQEADTARHLEATLRIGGQVGPVVNTLGNRAELEARLRVTEATASKFVEELTSANRRLGDALDDIKSTARQIVSILISREAESLRQQIAEVCSLFLELQGVADLQLGSTQLLHLDATTSEVLADGMMIVPKENTAARQVSNDSRTRRWKELWTRLLDGECDADFGQQVNSA